MSESESGARVASRELVEELMGTVVTVDFVLNALMGLSEAVLPGENRIEAIRELLTTSACHEVEAVGEEACRAATALIAEVVNRMADDVDAAAQLAEADEQKPC